MSDEPTRRGKAQQGPAETRRLRALVERYRKRSLAAGALTLVLAVVLAFVAADAFTGEAVLLGTGRAGVRDSAAVRGEVVGEGEASYYGQSLAGNPTASGESFDPSKLTAAHRTLPMGSRVRVTNLSNDASVVVRINDRGPYHGERILDLSHRAAEQIGMLTHGRVRVKIELLRDE